MQAEDSSTVDVTNVLRAREDAGGKVGRDDPFPANANGWVPATLHPPGYSLLLALLYEAGNFSSMLRWIVGIQLILDACTCVLVYIFARNIFGKKVALRAAWIYALLPAPILLSFQVLPDGLACFSAAVILTLASFVASEGVPAAVMTGAATGIACLFRAEFAIWTAISVLLVLCVTKIRRSRQLWLSTVLVGSFLIVMAPWTVWTYKATGHPVMTSTAGGGAMYLSLGEIPSNPWHVTPEDGWVSKDALRRGLPSAWTWEGDHYYKRLFVSSVISHPASYIRILVTQRLPLALAPAYYMGGDMWFTDHRVDEGLSRWQTLWRYPGATIRHEWFKLLMALLSWVLLGTLVYTVLNSAVGQSAWLWLPWIIMTAAISMIHQIDGRLLAPNLIVEVTSAGFFLCRRPAKASDLRVPEESGARRSEPIRVTS